MYTVLPTTAACAAGICGSELAARTVAHSKTVVSVVNWTDGVLGVVFFLLILLFLAGRSFRRDGVGMPAWLGRLAHPNRMSGGGGGPEA